MHVSKDTPACGHQAPKHPQSHRAVLYPRHQPVKFSAFPLCQIPTLRVSSWPCEVLKTPSEKQGSVHMSACACKKELASGLYMRCWPCNKMQ